MGWLALEAIFGLAIVTIAAFGAGAFLAQLLPAPYAKFERAAFILLGGIGVLSSTLFLLGQFAFTSWTIRITLALAIVSGVALFRRIFATRAPRPSVRSKVPLVPAMIVGSVLIVAAVAGLAEITGDWNNDTVSYHLLGPRVWLRDGVIRPVLDNCHTAFPQIAETLFATLWNVGGERAPSFSSFLTLGLLLAMAASFARLFKLTESESWWLAAIVASMPAVYSGAHACFVDAIFAAFVIAAARIGFDAQNRREWLAFGMFCGFAIGTKYTGLIAVPLLLVCVLLLNLRREGAHFRGVIVNAALAMAVAGLVGSPYYIRNAVLLGCPIYPPPPGYALFCSPKYLSATAIAAFHAYIRERGIGMGRGLLAFLLLPFNLTYHTANFHGAGGIGLFPFALGPVGAFRYRRNALVRVTLLLAFLLTLAWFFTQQESRFLIDVYVLAAIFSVLGLRGVLNTGKKSAKLLVYAVALISFSYGLLMIGRDSAQEVRAVFSPNYGAFRHRTTIPYAAGMEYLNRLPSAERVLILDQSVMPYYLDKDYMKLVGQWGEQPLPVGDSPQALALARSHQLHFTYVFDVSTSASPFQVPPNSPGLTQVFEAQNQRIYRIE